MAGRDLHRLAGAADPQRRGFAGAGAVHWREGAKPFREAPKPALQIIRVLFSTLEVAGFYWAVKYLSLADVMTFYLAAPIYVTAVSALFLREKVGWRRWSAVIVGFIGVIIALRPTSASWSAPALIALAGSFAFSFLMIVTRHLRGTSDTVLVTGQTVTALIFGAVLAPFYWVPLTLPTPLCWRFSAWWRWWRMSASTVR